MCKRWIFAAFPVALYLIGLVASRGQKSAREPLHPAGIGLFWMLVASIISTLHAQPTDAATRALLFPAAMLATYGATMIYITSPRLAARAIVVLMVVAAIVALFGIHGFVDFLADGGNEENRALYLSTPFFEHSYLAAQATLPVIPAALGVASAASTRVRFGLALLASPILLFLAIILSRAAWIATLAGIATVVGGLLIHRMALRRGEIVTSVGKFLVASVMITLSIVILTRTGIFGETARAVMTRFSSLFDPKLVAFNFSRLIVWDDTLRMIGDHLPFGSGVGTFGLEFGRYHEGSRPLSHAHNQYLHTLAEIGPLGLLGLVLAFLHPLSQGYHRLVHPRGNVEQTAALLGAMGGIVSLVVYGLVESPMQFATSAALFSFYVAVASRFSMAGESTPISEPPPASWRGRFLVPNLSSSALCIVVAIVIALPAAARHGRAGWIGYDAAEALKGGDPVRAATLANQASAISPSHHEVRIIQAEATRLAGHPVAALEYYRGLIQLVPSISSSYWHAGVCLVHLNRLDEGVSLLLEARARAEPDARPAILELLADCFARLHRHEEARLVYLELLTHNYQIENPTLLIRLAETLLNLGRDRPLASFLLRTFIKRVPESAGNYADGLLRDLDKYYPLPHPPVPKPGGSPPPRRGS